MMAGRLNGDEGADLVEQASGVLHVPAACRFFSTIAGEVIHQGDYPVSSVLR